MKSLTKLSNAVAWISLILLYIQKWIEFTCNVPSAFKLYIPVSHCYSYICMCVKYLFVCRHVVLYISIYTLTYWLCGYRESNWWSGRAPKSWMERNNLQKRMHAIPRDVSRHTASRQTHTQTHTCNFPCSSVVFCLL